MFIQEFAGLDQDQQDFSWHQQAENDPTQIGWLSLNSQDKQSHPNYLLQLFDFIFQCINCVNKASEKRNKEKKLELVCRKTVKAWEVLTGKLHPDSAPQVSGFCLRGDSGNTAQDHLQAWYKTQGSFLKPQCLILFWVISKDLWLWVPYLCYGSK